MLVDTPREATKGCEPQSEKVMNKFSSFTVIAFIGIVPVLIYVIWFKLFQMKLIYGLDFGLAMAAIWVSLMPRIPHE